ncbi:uncharacterized protein OCT59_014412 [Rhizophagus irregularis]|uniref:Uncharacterized protein n=3 Tax=Rhizophagus irregularis TaxID=588596 RepID=A0A015IEP7_RHIIW|nr:hypothetical protein GLOIN_2v1785237 [Rhizophagus irregularis DAOM 181602=DAOM 197198]EXX52460.1 hypothetical protein RirG_252780 [Rhizophagus irregularis DAOM 197198w]UZO22040.1 hypothetical protein OCT59_014412 [Rhizophagus irregularis]POG62510.1 hypothetical protein GLOIN_2v1785237 [Rhizophagus irregularis DAOM 181602=DAOM 197198]CAG8478882.1 5682_t:CDS:1 [Rhizophagus irregularis]GBC44552.1 hypothetical protein GLOIN_2v1785237 [Rhizophagus irregularis DAOM 181602=DAOM 197198]|eukprot:XP_025169376.1 hypothetical protein GLOIN_2v1785237 [Rhizophagus irregularis DAOM 181602=DAOM 197198]
MDNNYNFNFIDDGDIRPQTTDSQTENPNVNYNNSCFMMNTNTPDSVTNMSSQSYPIASSDLSFPLPQYTQQIQQAQQPIYQQNNTENNIQQQLFDTTQPISLNVPHFVQNSSSPFDASQINHSEIFTFEIPGIKIIVIPTFPPMINSSQTNNSEIFTFDIPGSKVIIITLSFQ